MRVGCAFGVGEEGVDRGKNGEGVRVFLEGKGVLQCMFRIGSGSGVGVQGNRDRFCDSEGRIMMIDCSIKNKSFIIIQYFMGGSQS